MMKRPAVLFLALAVCGMAWAQKEEPKKPVPKEPTVVIQADGEAEIEVQVQFDSGNGAGPVIVRKVVKTGKKEPVDAKPDADKKDPKDKPKTPPDVLVRLVGVSVLKPTEEQRRQNHWWSHGPGTTLTFEATVEKGALVSLLQQKCKLITLTDDLGTQLVATKKVGLLNRLRGVQPAVGHCIERWQRGRREPGSSQFRIGGVHCPVDGAMAIMLDAEVVFLYAGKEKTVKAKNVELKAGTKVDLGLAKMEIADIPANWGGNRHGFGLKYTYKNDTMRNRIKQWRFTKPDGDQIGQQGGGSRGGFANGRHTMTQYFYMPEKLKKVTIELTYWDETQEVKVPVNVNKGVGF